MDFMIADPYVVAVEGDANTLPPRLQGCSSDVPELRGRDGVNSQYVEGIVLLPSLYQANTYHLHMQSDDEAAAVWGGYSGPPITNRCVPHCHRPEVGDAVQ